MAWTWWPNTFLIYLHLCRIKKKKIRNIIFPSHFLPSCRNVYKSKVFKFYYSLLTSHSLIINWAFFCKKIMMECLNIRHGKIFSVIEKESFIFLYEKERREHHFRMVNTLGNISFPPENQKPKITEVEETYLDSLMGKHLTFRSHLHITSVIEKCTISISPN